MKSSEALRIIQNSKQSTMTSKDVSAWLDVSPSHASQILRRLSQSGHILPLKSGLWGDQNRLKPFLLPQAFSSPQPCYISLLTALSYHGLINQIPDVLFAVTLARTKTYHTPLGQVSLHHIQPKLFCGYELDRSNQFYIATPEKALFDCLYFSRSQVPWFKKLPEVEIDKGFHHKKLRQYIDLVEDPKRKTMIQKKLKDLLSA